MSISLILTEPPGFTDIFSYFRPQSLAWAVRKLSPGKGAAPSPPPVFTAEKTKSAAKSLEFAANGVTDNNVISWADRVKGKTATSTDNMMNTQVGLKKT